MLVYQEQDEVTGEMASQIYIEDDLASTPVLGRLHAQASDQTTETTDPDPEDSLAELLVESKYAGAGRGSSTSKKLVR